MIISQAKSTNPISSVFLVMLFWGLNIGVCVWEASDALTNWASFPVIEVLISQLSLVLIAVLLNFSFQKNKFVGVGNSLAGVVFLIFILGLNNVHEYYLELSSLLIISFANLRLIWIHNAPKNYLREFEIGILFGVAVLISPSFIILSLMLLIGMALVVSFTWRDFIVPIIGFLWVYLMKFCFLVFTDSFELESFFTLSFSYPKFDAKFSLTQILITMISLFEFGVLVRLFSVIEKRSIKERVYYWLWIWTAVFMFLALLFFQETFDKFVLIILLGLPCSVFSIEYFNKKQKSNKKWVDEFLLYGIISILLVLRLL